MLREQLLGSRALLSSALALRQASSSSALASAGSLLSSAPRPFGEGIVLLINRVKGGGRPGEDQNDFRKRKAAITALLRRYETEGQEVRGSKLRKEMEVKEFRDDDKELMGCIACTARLFNSASLIVGVHGAGLSNALFARAGTVLIEAVGFGNPLCYMDLAFTLGLEYHRISDYQVYNDVPKFAQTLGAVLAKGR